MNVKLITERMVKKDMNTLSEIHFFRTLRQHRVNLKCILLFLFAFQFFTITSLAQTTLHQFGQSGGPQGSLISDGTFLYGMTFHGGANNLGTVFKILPDGTGYVSLRDFDGTNGSEPTGSLFSDGTYLYGMTSKGGSSDKGTVFKMLLNGTGYEKLLDFSGTNGNYPKGSLISDGTFLYGMTSLGGAGNMGTIFKLMPDGTGFQKLQDFNGTNGAYPYGSLFFDGTFLFGLTSSGGANNWGTIFKIMPNGMSYSIMVDLTPLTGGFPSGSLISDGTFLYGVTSSGGTSVGSRGTLFKVLPNGTSFSILHEFDINTGSDPLGSLFYDGTFLYGTTSYGGAFVGPSSDYSGTLFKIMPDGSGFVNLIDFSNPSGRPLGDLFFDGSFLYGMTSSGGRIFNDWLNLGSIFKVMPDGTGYQIVIDFPGPSGNRPEGSLVSDGTWLYGITLRGGLKNSGIIFKILPDGTGYTKLFEFDNATGSPAGSLTFDGTYLYGMTSSGGLFGAGTVFKILPDGTGFEQIWIFFDGINPYGSLYFDGTYLYGMTYYGGTDFKGIIFKILTDGNGYSKLLDFTGSNGANPYGSLISDGTFLYGTTTNGGINNLGTTFKILPDGTGFSKLIDFDGINGSSPNGSLFSDGIFLYGTTKVGGANNRGTIYKIMLDGSAYSKLIDFSGFNCGYAPSQTLVSDGTFLYGVTNRTIYKIKPDGTFFESLIDFGIFSAPVGIFSDGIFLYGMTSNVDTYNWGTVFKYDIPSTGFTPINFTPSSGPIGTIVTITGANLTGATSVSFNGTPATSFTVVSGTSITATVPTGATTGKIVVKVGCTVFTSLTDFIVTAGPVAPTIINFTPTSGPVGTTVTITGTNFDLISANNDVKFNGVSAAPPSSASVTNLTVTVPGGATTGPISVTTLGGTGASSTNFTVTCITPPAPSAPSVSRCGNGTVILIATDATGTQEYRWYDVPSGGTSQSSAANFTTPSIGTTTSFYVSIFDVAGSCESNRTQVDAIVNTPPGAPGPINNSGCSGTSISVSASGGSSGQYRWYTDATGGSPIAGQTNDTYSTPNLTNNTSYYAAINNGTCESTRTEVIATVIPLPTAPVVQPVNPVCPGSDITLTATGGTNGQYRWYEGVVLISGAENNTYSVSNVIATKTVQVAIYDGNCESLKASATISIKNCTPPVITPVIATAFLEGTITINLCELISDPEDDLDLTSLQAIGSLTSGAPFTINGCSLTIDYEGIPFPGTDELTLRICDLTGLCTEQLVSVELGGEIEIYNALSPNGDGRNDTFYIQYINILPSTKKNKVYIYNRWGDVVWETENYDNTENVFTGITSNGKDLPSGTYYYKIEFAGQKSLLGFITLKR